MAHFPHMSPTTPDRPPSNEPEAGMIRVSISEASRLFGVHQRTIRRAITTGELRYIVVRGRYKIQFESLVNWSQRSSAARTKRDTEGIGQWVSQWKIRNPKYSPRAPQTN
jgi:excisionase family DNA binding protein